ncbi:MAG: hypothetical protein JO352_39370 [Chloroflexi bacterium]|nr:hypothetical protein [Chloroflexota bacterium]
MLVRPGSNPTADKPAAPLRQLFSGPGSSGVFRNTSWTSFRRRLTYHAWPIALLVLATIFIFRYPLLLGYRFIGNSDRYNQYLAFVDFYKQNLTGGGFSAWSEHMYGGFDLLSLAFSFPSPLFLFAVLFRDADLIRVFTYVAAGLMLATLVLTYWVLHQFTRDRLAAFTGACIYSLATYPLLKLAQNDDTYFSVLFAPLMFHIVHNADRARLLRSIAALGAIVAFCIYCAFLQEFSYIVLFLLAYGVWRFARGNRGPLLAMIGGLSVGLALALPRLVALYQSTTDTLRVGGGLNDLEYVGPVTLLRFFSRDIFGRSFAENTQGPNVNLFEGNLLFVSVFASLLLVVIFARLGHGLTLTHGLDRADAVFLSGYVVFVFATIHVPAVYRLVTVLYANISFPHTRIDVSALLPIALLSALFLTRARRGRPTARSVAVIAGFTLAVVIATTADYTSAAALVGWAAPPFLQCAVCQVDRQPVDVLAIDVMRFGVIASLFVLLLLARRVLPWFSRDALKATLAICISFQAVWGAWVWLSGPVTRDYVSPYQGNDLVMAPPGQFELPGAAQADALRQRLANDDYRSITICPETVMVADCSPILGLVWRVRLADGYLSGVTSRYASLPWAQKRPDGRIVTGVGLHDIRFNTLDQVPWKLLALLNVKSAIVVDGNLYSNTDWSPDSLDVIPNPSSYIYPRAYFAEGVFPVTAEQDITAIRREFGLCDGCVNLLDQPAPVDYVEGPVFGQFDAGSSPSVSGGGDRIDVSFPASDQPRFLVLNEAYAPGWTASSGGQPLAVFPTNVVMRGVVVPPGATSVRFAYHSFLEGAVWYTLALVAGAITLAGVYAWTLQRRR